MPTPRPLGQTAALPPAVAELIRQANAPGFTAWRANITRAGGCTNPVHLVGTADTVDTATGEILHTHTSADGRLLVACGNRRATVCPTCSRLYRGDTYQLIRAGLIGGKDTPGTVTAHPRAFVTLTAPGFGPVHTRREIGGKVQRCRPRRAGGTCPHGLPLGCPIRHTEEDAQLGEPLCPNCYDYPGAVLWQAHAGALWHRFTIQLRRELARAGGMSRARLARMLRLSFAKVAEYQRRGLVHFHAVIRLDGPTGPEDEPPGWATLPVLEAAIHGAAKRVRVLAPGAEVLGRRLELRFGRQLDVRPIDAFGPGERITSAAVAGYIAKYATKGAESAGAVDRRIRHLSELESIPLRPHARRMIETCWELGGLEPLADLALRRWSHMLGFRGHFSTKSRHYSTTLGTLRQTRTDHRAAERARRLGLADRPTLVIGHWRYAGRGYTPAEALIASASASADPGGEGAPWLNVS
ncbi:replication initiator [Phaeacidiphilus oryzae]|uniref:replication initiator n=1 Tax=Phaeacidiphilus oryzae TaxID=348818 RepID=UPI0006919DF8|nr:replication initiator [Phaeacidiphilus oryzae]